MVTEADVVCLVFFIIVLCGRPPLGMFTCTVKPGVEMRKPSRRRVCPPGGQEAGGRGLLLGGLGAGGGPRPAGDRGQPRAEVGLVALPRTCSCLPAWRTHSLWLSRSLTLGLRGSPCSRRGAALARLGPARQSLLFKAAGGRCLLRPALPTIRQFPSLPGLQHCPGWATSVLAVRTFVLWLLRSWVLRASPGTWGTRASLRDSVGLIGGARVTVGHLPKGPGTRSGGPGWPKWPRGGLLRAVARLGAPIPV